MIGVKITDNASDNLLYTVVQDDNECDDIREKATTILFLRFYKILLPYAKSQFNFSDEVADEVVMDTLIDLFFDKKQLFKHISENPNAFKSYVFTCLRNRCINELKKWKRRDRIEQTHLHKNGHYFHLDIHDKIQVEEMISAAKLSENEGAVIWLTYWYDLKPADIGKLLRTSASRVSRTLYRARRKLKSIRAEYE